MLLCPCPPGHPQPQGLTRGGDVSPGDGGLWFPRGQAHQGHIGALVHDDVAGDPEYLGRHCKETGTGVRELLLGVPGSPSGLKHRQGLKGNSAEPPSGGTALSITFQELSPGFQTPQPKSSNFLSLCKAGGVPRKMDAPA